MTQRSSTRNQVAGYLEEFQTFHSAIARRDPNWVGDIRRDAITAFNNLGFPTNRRGNEEWKYTDVRSLARTRFVLSKSVQHQASDIDLGGYLLGEPNWANLVFVDGVFSRDLSSRGFVGPGIYIDNLAEALIEKPELVQPHLAKHIDYQANAFAALNTSFMHDGAFINVSDNLSVEQPIHALFLNTGLQPDTVSHPRILLVVGVNSQVTLVESYRGHSSGINFVNAVTEIVGDAGSVIEHYRLQQQNEHAFYISNTQARVRRDSSFSSISVDVGGGLVRNNLNVSMEGEGGSCRLNGLYMVTGTQHVDNQVIIDHTAPHTTSRELYKGILDGKSRSVFHGSIIVRPGAVKVDALQEDKNLLLSDQAEADTKPAFWVYCDDVRCGHGAACGQIDENALFYLRNRGLSEQAARRFLTRGFVWDIIQSIRNGFIQAHVDDLTQATLRDWLGDESD